MWIPNHGKFPNYVVYFCHFPNHVLWENVSSIYPISDCLIGLMVACCSQEITETLQKASQVNKLDIHG